MHWFQKLQDNNFELTISGEVKDKTWVMNNMKIYFQEKLYRKISGSYLNKHSIIRQDDVDRKYYSNLLQKWKQNGFNIKQINLQQNQIKALGCLVGLSIGDALGASTQFQPYNKQRKYWIENDFQDLKQCIQKRQLYARHSQTGIWTDDCSMALAMSNSLILNDYKFNPTHIRFMFHLWLQHGLGNGGRSHSIGLGGNISMSMSEFRSQQNQFTKQGNQQTCGNGSLMRLAPIPIAFKDSLDESLKNSKLASLTTHKGSEAAQCCRLLSNIIVCLIKRKEQNWRLVIEDVCEKFISDVQSVKYLAMSKQQTQQMYDKKCQKSQSYFKVNKTLNDRNWNWKDPKFQYSPSRAKMQPGYVGSYCMDALSMALHIVWHKDTFKQMILWAINMGGDCDTVGAIVGQIAGAIHGFNNQIFHLYSQMEDFISNRFQIFLHGVKLATHRKIDLENIQKNNEIIQG